ncbi:MAG: peptidase M1 [Saprospiraceae bacterium]|nr:peptidase M1 [Saprospiraceae bacterium]
MWYEILKFEVNYRVKRPETYLFFLFLLLFSLFGVEFVFEGVDLGLVKKNAPIVIAKSMCAITGISLMIVSLIMGVPVLRDFQYNMESLIYVNPISKRDYFLGRFLGSMLVLLFVFSGVLWGMMLGSVMPWINPDEYLSFQLINYVQPFLWVALPIVFFGACVFYVTGALSRNMMVVYTQGIIIFVLFMLTKAVTNETLQALLDPFSLTTLTQASKNWTIAERNTSLIPLAGDMFYNKIFWTFLALGTLVFGYFRLKLNVISGKKSRKQSIHTKEEKPLIRKINKELPVITPEYGIGALGTQLFFNSWFHARSILKQTSFWAIAVCGLIIIVINSVNLGTSYGVDSYPTTYLIIEELQEMSIYFFIIILVFYSAEVMWNEREANLNLIYDSTPSDGFINLAGKFLGLLIIYTILILSFISMGVIFQAMNGYYRFELGVYFSGFFLEVFPFLALYTMVALFFQALLGSKYVGILATLGFFIVNLAISLFGIDHVLVNYGGNALGTYSEMNGYGLFLKPFLWVKTYWFFFGTLLLVVSSVLMVRGSDTGWKQRWKAGFSQAGKPLKLFAFANVILFAGTGSYIFYNTNVLNEFWTDSEQNIYRAEYEKSLKTFEYIPQPLIVDVNLKVDLFPSRRAYDAEGYYMLSNPYEEAIHEIHVQKLIDEHVALESVTFERESTPDHSYAPFYYTIYTLKEPLAPGDSLKMHFKQSYQPAGFESKNENSDVVHNGTFFDYGVFPTLGYRRKYELSDEDIREEYGMDPRKYYAEREDARELSNARSGSDSKGINLDITLSTESPQRAITTGNLVNEWSKDGRNYFHYLSDQDIINFYAIVSAEYEVEKDTWMDSHNTDGEVVGLEIYYHQGHEFNLDRMMESMKQSLEYYSNHFSPYQYKQLRIMEFPRNRQFAQSFPGAIPFSEAIGFIMDIDDDQDVDMVYYITAHEVAHQWWGMQLEAANVSGRNMILETLSQYSAMMVLKEKYGEEKVKQFLQLQLEDYQEGIRRQKKEELPLSLVENEDHIYYAKGAINMYALTECIGEDKVNLALQNFLQDWHSFDNPDKADRYATTRDLLQYFKEVTSPGDHHVISDLFERVVSIDKEVLDY